MRATVGLGRKARIPDGAGMRGNGTFGCKRQWREHAEAQEGPSLHPFTPARSRAGSHATMISWMSSFII